MIPSNAQVKELIPLVRYIAWKIHRTMPHSIIGRDDLEQIGMLGLLDAFRLYKEVPGSGFRTYASNRIHGAIMDELRERDPIRRVKRHTLNDIERTSNELQGALGRPARASEVADRLNITLTKYHRAKAEAQTTLPGDFEYSNGGEILEHIQDDRVVDPYDVLASKRRFLSVLERIERLPGREKTMIQLYYGKGLTLKTIGQQYGLNETRVCQIVKKTLRRLRAALADWQ